MDYEEPMPGKFIVLEGLDGSGTTTQTRLLSKKVMEAGHNVALAYEPSGPLEKSVREAIHDQENRWPLLWLFAASRASNLTKVEPLLAKGLHVVCDRYRLSSMAYQSMDHDIRYIWEVNSRFRTPDLTLFLRVPVATCLERLSSRPNRDPFETEEVLSRADLAYDEAIAIERENGGIVHIIDGTLSQECVLEALWGHVFELLSR